MFPLEFLYIKVFRRGTRQIMKVSVGTAKILWFEFGGHLLKNVCMDAGMTSNMNYIFLSIDVLEYLA